MEGLTSSSEFQRLAHELNAITETTADTCEKHNVSLIQIKGLTPFCVACKKEENAEWEQIRVKAAAERELKRNNYSWLQDKSILSDQTLKSASFANFEVAAAEETRNKQLAERIANKYLNDETFNTIITGIPGTGKSHLAMAILEEVNERGKPSKKCLYVSVDEVMRRIKGSFNNKESIYTEEFITNLCAAPDVLVLDDLGAETGTIDSGRQATDYTTKVLYAIINARMSKSTIVTTNLNSKQLTNMYDRKLLSRMYRGVKANGSLITFKETADKRMDLEF